MCERTNELPTDDILSLFRSCDLEGWDSTDGRNQLAALQSAAQKVLPVPKYNLMQVTESNLFLSVAFDEDEYIRYAHITYTHATGSVKPSGMEITIDQVLAMRVLFATMQGNSAEARALREEYAG